MKVSIHSSLIFRTPKFSYTAQLVDCWEELKAAIEISSKPFYETIKDVKETDLDALPPKIYFTVWKYFNRAKFRSTPYGTFASFTLLNDGIKQDEDQIVIDKTLKLTELIDWPQKNNVEVNFSDLLQKNCLLFTNSSYYLTPQSCRYIACTDGVFELAEIDKDPFVLQILENCLSPITVNQLVENLGSHHVDLPVLYELLQDMHQLQLIFTNYDVNIIGEDYFDRIGMKAAAETPTYIIAERTAQAGGINHHLLKAVPGLVDLLQSVIPPTTHTALKQFVQKFTKKFEDKEIPLVQALDPEIGVGYDELEQAGLNDDFIALLNNKKKKDADDIKSVLSQKISPQSFQVGETIYLNKLPLKPVEKITPLPNSTSMLMTVVDDLVFVDQIGGATANALSGRFTMASSKVEAYCKATAELEQNANDEVLFFDVAYMVETTVDNINRRKLVYNHQLSILNFDTSANPLTLNDIQISIRGGEIILRSKKLNKRVIPKMASAYNYTRSDLSVFRLLCDLQHHQVQTNLNLSLDKIFPDLDYYPRLQYQNMVLNAAKWRVTKQNLIGADKQPMAVADCRDYLMKRGLQGHFKTGKSDQTLCFNINSDSDISAFLQYMQKQESIYLEEVVLPHKSAVTDEEGKPYLAQFILNLYHHEKLYQNVAAQHKPATVKEIFPPGKEWLYFELFCHHQRADEILVTIIAPFVENHLPYIKSWFFIRYNENGDHIRFRIQLHHEQDGQKITSLFVSDIEEYLTAGLISDIQLKTYKRELNRYSAALINDVELHFGKDSNYVLSLLAVQPDNWAKYKLCAKLVQYIRSAGVFSAEELIKRVKYMSDAFNQEHDLEPADFKKINSQYQQFKNSPGLELTDPQEKFFEEFAQSLTATLNLAPLNRKAKLFSDLIHMHVNRLFSRNQRTHEMIMYYFLLKDIQRFNAMKS